MTEPRQIERVDRGLEPVLTEVKVVTHRPQDYRLLDTKTGQTWQIRDGVWDIADDLRVPNGLLLSQVKRDRYIIGLARKMATMSGPLNIHWPAVVGWLMGHGFDHEDVGTVR